MGLTGQPASATPSANKLWLSVPIFYVGDRKRAGEPTLDKKHDISCKSITYAVVHIGVPPNQWNAAQLDSLRLWGCNTVPAEEGRKLTGNFNKQLNASGVTVNTNFEIDGKCGTSPAEMARQLNLSTETIRTQLKRVTTRHTMAARWIDFLSYEISSSGSIRRRLL